MYADACGRMLMYAAASQMPLATVRFFLPISWIYVLSEPTLDRFRSLGKVRGEILMSSRFLCCEVESVLDV
jgi:hypothetical protein